MVKVQKMVMKLPKKGQSGNPALHMFVCEYVVTLGGRTLVGQPADNQCSANHRLANLLVGQSWHSQWLAKLWLANHQPYHGWPSYGWPTTDYAMVGQPMVGGWDA